MKKYLVLIPIWVVIAAVSAIIGLRIIDPMADYRLARDGVMTKGTVTKLEPENHRFIHYSYVVNGDTYSGFGNGGRGNPDFEDVRIGQEVIVFYDPNFVQSSSLGYAGQNFQVNFAGVIFVTLVLPFFIIIPLWLVIRFVISGSSTKRNSSLARLRQLGKRC